MKALKKILHQIYLFFAIKKDPVKAKKKRKKWDDDTSAGFGQFTTIKSVLNSLDDLFDDMRALKPKGKEFQRLVKRYGPYICSLETSGGVGFGVIAGSKGVERTRLDAGFKAYGLPTFLIHYTDKRWIQVKDDIPIGEFFIARKQRSFPYLKPKNGAVCYECCAIGVLEKEALEIEFNIIVNRDGNVTAYPYLAQIPRRVGGIVVSSRMGLYYPDFENLNDRHNIDHRKKHLVELFCANYNMVMSREASINIVVKKGKERATITVPPGRWKYFFKDREKIKSASGRMKPIFHAVASHHRHLSGGKVSNVKTHYRGLRSFRWGDYSIKIILPGKHAAAQASFGLAGEIVDQDKIDSGKWVDLGGRKVSERLNKVFEGYDHAN